MPNYVLTCFGNGKFVQFSLNSNNYFWLLDTGASLSVIKFEALPISIPIHFEEVVVNGVGGQIISKGYVNLRLNYESNKSFIHKFYVFENLPIKADGILGLDFLTKFECNIDLDNNNLILKHEFEPPSEIKIFDEPHYQNNTLKIPPRSESIHFIKLKTKLKDDSVIIADELKEDVFLASSIISPGKYTIPVKILNVSDNEISLPAFEPNIYSLSDYEICQFTKTKSKVNRAEQLKNLLKLEHLNNEERNSIESICNKYSDIFYVPGDTLTTTNVCEQKITLKPNSTPVYTKPYRLPQSLKPEIKKQIQDMIKNDIIEEAQSEWSSPILLVPKKSNNNDKKWRLVIDFRKLNEKIVDDKYPLPNITEILDSLTGAVYFTHLDLYQGYYQVNLNKDSRPLTAFTTDTGQYQLKRMPQGLKTSPNFFSKVISISMSGLNFEKCFVYLDDLIVFGRNLDSHNKNLIDVFERLRKVNFKLSPEKCQFMKKEILYLGHVVTKDGVLPDPEKVAILQKYPRPQNTDEVRRFTAFCNYYRKFIKSFSEITVPLNQLCRKNVPFIWTNECESAFQYLKKCLTTPPILQYPNFDADNEFIIQTDASGIAVGAVLCNNDLKPVAYASRPLNKAERQYPTVEKELVAIVWAIKYFKPYIFGREFTILTDHKPLVYLFGMKDPSTRLMKFRLLLEEFNFKVVYIKGNENVVADALSRIVVTSDELKRMNEQFVNVMTRGQKKRLEQQLIESKKSGENSGDIDLPTDKWPDQPRVVDILKKPYDSVEMIFMKEEELQKLRNKNEIREEYECFSIIEKKGALCINLNFKACFSRAEFVQKLSWYCEQVDIKEICIVKTKDNVEFVKDLCNEIKLREKWSGPRICILRGVTSITQENERNFILNDYHLLPTSGHAGVRRMVNNIKRRYYWPNIDKDVQEYVKKCSKCQLMKHSRHTKQPMEMTSTASSAFEKIFLDLVGPLDKDIDDNCYILSIQCELSKFVLAYPLKNKETVTVARTFVNNFILIFGIPKIIATDRGTEFVSSTMNEVSNLLGIQKLTSTSYHHQSIGALENAHKHLGSFLRIQCEKHHDSWSYWLPYWCFGFNNTVHTATKYTPYELVFGKPSNIPSRVIDDNNTVSPLYNHDDYALNLKYRLQTACKDARNNLVLSKEKQKQYYDKTTNPIVYEKDSLILVKNETGRKLHPLYEGPYIVIEDLGCNVKIQKNNKYEIVHKNRTKMFNS